MLFESSKPGIWGNEEEIMAHVVLSTIGEAGSRKELKLPVLSPGLVLMALQGSPVPEKVTNDDELRPQDVNTLTCLVFQSKKDRHEMELRPDVYQPVHFMQKGINRSEGNFLANTEGTETRLLMSKLPLEGQFVTQLDFGRPKTRWLVLSKEHISLSREKPDSTSLNTKLCHREDAILVAFHPNGDAKVPQVVGSITFFGRKEVETPLLSQLQQSTLPRLMI